MKNIHYIERAVNGSQVNAVVVVVVFPVDGCVYVRAERLASLYKCVT